MDLDANENLELEPTEVVPEEEKDWKAEALKYKAIAKRLKDKPQVSQHIDNLTTEKPAPKIDDALWDVADYIRDGYDRNTVEFITKNGGREALKDPNSLVSLAVKAAKEQARAEQAASQTSDSSGLTEAERKYTPEQLKNMSREELAKVLPHA